MGLLPSGATALIRTGNYQVIQTYAIEVPNALTPTFYTSKTIHNGGSLIRVTDHGSEVREAFNQDLVEPGSLKPGRYSFTCSNLDGLLSFDSDFWINEATAYTASPVQCVVFRFCTIFGAGSTHFLTPTLVRYDIEKIDYHNHGYDPLECTIYCAQRDLAKLTDHVWDKDDYDELDLGVFMGAPVPGEN